MSGSGKLSAYYQASGEFVGKAGKLMLRRRSMKVSAKVVSVLAQTQFTQPQVALPFIYIQETPSTIWTLVHNRGHIADVTIYDENGKQIIGEITHDNENITTVVFSIPVMGTARVD